jgi:hypothetical protein
VAGGREAPGGARSYFGVTMAPGFTAPCFEGGRAADLLASHPARAADIERLSVRAGEPSSMPESFQNQALHNPARAVCELMRGFTSHDNEIR